MSPAAQAKVFCEDVGSIDSATPPSGSTSTGMMTAQRKLFLVWLAAGMVPFILQLRSYLKFVTPHKVNQNLVVPAGLQEETHNMFELCPVRGLFLSESWWNLDVTHYFVEEHGVLCHFVVPQYNVHGNYLIGNSTAEPYKTTPSSCANDSFHYEQYFYHGSIGYYSYYEEQKGSYCAKDQTAYIVANGLGTFDMNGSTLAADRGSQNYRMSCWYAIAGTMWLTYRVLVLRRSFIVANCFGHKCDQLGQSLTRKEAVVFVQENLRLSAHGATYYHRGALLYLLVEGIMTDLFLIVANSGFGTKLQYVSMGYNLSGLMLLIFELFEASTLLREKWRLFIKRLLFSYETALLGEVLSSALQQYCITGLNRSSMKESRPTAVAVSYYVWSLVGHGIFVLCLTGFVVTFRALWALGYAWWEYRTWVIFTAPCCVDTTLKLRNKMAMLGGYCWEHSKLYYKASTLKAFGLLKMGEEDGAEFFAIHKLYWFSAPRDNLYVIGVISGQRVEPCGERPCTGVVSFFDHRVGGSKDDIGPKQPQFVKVQNSRTAAI